MVSLFRKPRVHIRRASFVPLWRAAGHTARPIHRCIPRCPPWVPLVDVLRRHRSHVAVDPPVTRVVVGWLHAAATAVPGVGVGRPAVTSRTADGAALVEPQEVLTDIARLGSVVAIPAPAAPVIGRIARGVAKPSTRPRWEVAARHQCVSAARVLARGQQGLAGGTPEARGQKGALQGGWTVDNYTGVMAEGGFAPVSSVAWHR
jgi:hypothetical protein